MASGKKTYFLVPGWDIPASAIQLGNIIADPTEPHKPLNPIPPQRLEASATPEVTSTSTSTASFTIDTQTYPTKVTNYTTTLFSNKSNKLSLFAQFLQIFGLGGETSVEFTSDDVDTCTFETLLTEWFIPSAQFINGAMAQEPIQGFLKMAPPKTPLYVITGLRTGAGITAKTVNSKGKNLSGKIGVDGTPAGLPLSAGPLAEHRRKKGEEVAWEAEGPLVFAYQLYRVKFAKGAWDKKGFVKGALFGVDEEGKVKNVTVDEEGDNEDFAEELEDVDVKEGWDEVDGEECVVIVPERRGRGLV
jgi:hypothetical protein